jgi:hypothetical protein
MKATTLILLYTASQILAADDTNLVAAGEWSQPVGQDGLAIRGRLLICDTPNHASSSPRPDTAVYLELQEFSSALQSVRVYCGLNRFNVPIDSPGLHCELRDSSGKIVPASPGGFSGGEPGSYWVTLKPYCSARLRASVYGGGRLDDGGLAIYLCSHQAWWDVHPSKTNEYFLSGTFSSPGLTTAVAVPPAKIDPDTGLPAKMESNTGPSAMLDVDTGKPIEGNPTPPPFFYSTNRDVWSGTLRLPPVKIPLIKP